MSTNVLAAIFPDRESAVATRAALGDEHYRYRWLAVTQPSEKPDVPASGPHSVAVHQLTESSDGAVGAVGRFLSGAGSSLRKALEDHGVSRDDAEAIDAAAPPSGAILVVHAAPDRSAEAVATLRRGGGTLYPAGNAVPAGEGAALSESEARERGLIPSYDTSGPGTSVGARDADVVANDVSSATGADVAGVTNSVGSTPQDRARQAASNESASTFGSDDAGDVVRERVVNEMVSIELPVEREEIFIERRRPV